MSDRTMGVLFAMSLEMQEITKILPSIVDVSTQSVKVRLVLPLQKMLHGNEPLVLSFAKGYFSGKNREYSSVKNALIMQLNDVFLKDSSDTELYKLVDCYMDEISEEFLHLWLASNYEAVQIWEYFETNLEKFIKNYSYDINFAVLGTITAQDVEGLNDYDSDFKDEVIAFLCSEKLELVQEFYIEHFLMDGE
jgi:hypothetical protein